MPHANYYILVSTMDSQQDSYRNESPYPFHQSPVKGAAPREEEGSGSWFKAGTDGRKDTGTVREKNLRLSSNK